MTNIHFLEMIHQFDDIIQTHVLLQLQEETDMASRLVLISYLEMEMPGNRSKDILKFSVFVNQWELGISVSAVNKHIVKGLRTLREKLKGKQ